MPNCAFGRKLPNRGAMFTAPHPNLQMRRGTARARKSPALLALLTVLSLNGEHQQCKPTNYK